MHVEVSQKWDLKSGQNRFFTLLSLGVLLMIIDICIVCNSSQNLFIHCIASLLYLTAKKMDIQRQQHTSQPFFAQELNAKSSDSRPPVLSTIPMLIVHHRQSLSPFTSPSQASQSPPLSFSPPNIFKAEEDKYEVAILKQPLHQCTFHFLCLLYENKILIFPPSPIFINVTLLVTLITNHRYCCQSYLH